jgi:hypothetical protein
MRRSLSLPALVLLGACAASDPATPLPESDAHAVMDPDRDLHLRLDDGRVVQLTDLPGAEDGEALSPDGRWVAFVGGDTGIASVWAVRVPAGGEKAPAPVQLTNVSLEHQPRTPGQAPEGFVPLPDDGPLRWIDARTIAWTAAGVEHRVEVPR